MLASMWLETCGCPSAWVSLDDGDNDLHGFTAYLLAALHSIFPSVELKTRHLLITPTLPPASVLARQLLSDMEQVPQPFILAFDDIHLIREQSIFDLLTELLRHPSPGMHLLLIGRQDPALPIASLRARVQVTEIRARDLEFSPSETSQLMSEVLHREIDDKTALEWTKKTEGWVTALWLAALALRNSDSMDDLGIDVTGDSHYIQEYLLADVLARLAPARKEWLLKTSLLEFFNASLCEAVCCKDSALNETGLTGKDFIRWLREENLFLFPLDNQGQWFRFHHLFRDLLQNLLHEQLSEAQVASLYQRASEWCTENDQLEYAIHYALAAKDSSAAVKLVVKHRYTLMNTDQWQLLNRWLNQLPHEEVINTPLLLNTRGFLALQRGEENEVITIVQQVRRLLEMTSSETEEYAVAMAEAAVMQLAADLSLGKFTLVVEQAQQCLLDLPAHALHIRVLAISFAAFALHHVGDMEAITALLRDSMMGLPWSALTRAKLAVVAFLVNLWQANLDGAQEWAGSCLRLAEEAQSTEMMSWGRYGLGITHYLRNELTLAEPYLSALLIDRAYSAPMCMVFGSMVLMLIYHASERQAEAAQVVELVSGSLWDMKHTRAFTLSSLLRAEHAFRNGEMEKALKFFKRSNFEEHQSIQYLYAPAPVVYKLLLADETPESLLAVRTRLEAWLERLSQENYLHLRIDALALLALVHARLGQESEALEKLGTALDLAVSGHAIRPFVDLDAPMTDLMSRLYKQEKGSNSPKLPFIEKVLAAFTSPAQNGKRPDLPAQDSSLLLVERGEFTSHRPLLVKTLTRRELQVLKLLATELYPEEMAGKLYTSTSTMRTHIRNIYTKLDVTQPL